MHLHPRFVERISPLKPLLQSALSPEIQVLQAAYLRKIPAQYLGNPYTQEQVIVNVLLVSNARLVVPKKPQTSFIDFYRQLGREDPALLQRIISPSGTAKSAASNCTSPIKEITGMCLSGFSLPGDAQFYGWSALQNEALNQALHLSLLFQGNGLFYNRGSVLYDGDNLLAYPDMFLADLLTQDLPGQVRERIAVSEPSLKRNLLFFVLTSEGRMQAYVHQFLPTETYRQGMTRLQQSFRDRQVSCAMAASPPLIIPGEHNQPVYLSLEEILGEYHANDVRHALYCPYENAVLLSGELGRAQCLQPALLASSIASQDGEPLRMPLSESLDFHSPQEMAAILDKHGYRGRFSLDMVEDRAVLSIQPLEGVYSHLIPFLTRAGVFGLIQTSGTHGNITGNDGPTLHQLSAILRDLNSQPPFATDPIIAAASGSQGNDVPNIVCRSVGGEPGLLANLVPPASLDDHPIHRGTVTTPRVGIAVLNDR
jgi:hypothetical protein